MEQIQSLIPPLLTQNAVPSFDELLAMQTDNYNTAPGSMTGYHCDACHNKGWIAKVKNSELCMTECGCMKIRFTLQRIRESGLEKQFRDCKFSNFETAEPWQQEMKSAAMRYLESNAVGFFIGGQSGCGKTHICTAIVGSMIKRGMSARYFDWREESPILKSLVNDAEYLVLMREYKLADCLYIDDLFKGGATDADKKLAFELVNYRYRNKLKTVISTELTEKELIQTDEALAGRILQMAKGHRMVIVRNAKRNYRLR